MASTTQQNASKLQVYPQNICRKCIFPKPARAHHCSVCSRCILNQDHHCPWINNCVGQFNHRYFFQFCFFLTLGSFYVSTLGFSEFQHYLFGQKAFSYSDLFLGRNLNDVAALPNVTNPSTSYTFLFLFIVAVTACVVLCGFTLWHFWLITRAETTIEFHVNSTERKRLKKLKEKFINPYDFGFVANWKMFLGLNNWYDIFYKNLLPSAHKPFCDGIYWPMTNLDKSMKQKQNLRLMDV